MVDAREYHRRTNHTPRSVREDDFSLDHSNRPRPYKRYEDLPRVDLSRIRPPRIPTLSAVASAKADPRGGTGDGGENREIDRETLATLCYLSSGIVQRIEGRGRELLFRAASCTGKLYHIDLYPVCGDVEGLSAGVYHFDPRTFSLDRVREGDYRGVLAEASDHPGVADAPVTFAVTSTWWRNAWKYRDRTYRHAFWDSGTVLANLLAAAHATDCRAEVVAGFADDPVASLLGVDPDDEAPLELVPVGGGDPAPDPPSVEPIAPETVPLSPRPVDYPRIPDAWRQSTLPDGDAAAEWRAECCEAGTFRDTDPASTDAVALDPVDPETASSRPLYETVRRRGSCREYADRGPSRRQVATVLDRATRGVPGDWSEGGDPGLAYNRVYVLATGVDGVPDGTYRYRPGDAAMDRVGDATKATKTHLALDQEWAGDAHVNVYLLADLDRVVEHLGNRGYRLAQLEGGITLGRLYLATYAHRVLGGTGLTFYDDHVADHCAPGTGLTPTCLFAFGRRRDVVARRTS